MIKVKKIEVGNYRSCINTKIDVNTDLTALIGINGVGKSNILNAIQLLKRISRSRSRNTLIYKTKHTSLPFSAINIILEVDGIKYQLKSDIYYETDETNTDDVNFANVRIKEISSNVKKWINIDTDLFEITEYIRKSSNPMSFEQFVPKKRYSPQQIKLLSKVLPFLVNMSYYSATQFSDPSKCPISLELEDSRLIRPNRKSKTHEEFIYDMYKTYQTDQKAYDRYIDIVNQNGIGLVDNITFSEHEIPNNSYKIKAGGQVQKIERTKKIIVPSIILDNLTLSPNQLSEGTFKTLALIFYILNDECELLLIEEPEVCVHHGLLSSIIELIKIQSNYKQIFVSTHSDYVLDKLKPENIVLVKKYKELGTVANTLSKTLSKNEFAALKDYLSNTGNLGEYWKEGGLDDE